MSALLYTVGHELTTSQAAALAALAAHQTVAVRFGLEGPETVCKPIRHELIPAPRRNLKGHFLPVVKPAAYSVGVHYLLDCGGKKQDVLRAENWEQALHRAELKSCALVAGNAQHDEHRDARRPL